MTNDADNLILLAQIGAAHGVKGEVRVKPFGDDPLSFTDYGNLQTKDGTRRFKVAAARVHKGVVVTKFKGVNDRNAAEALNGLKLYVPRDQFPDPDEDEFYHADLIGMDVVSKNGEPLGKIVSLQNFGAGDLLEIAPETSASFFLPFTLECVPEVLIAERKIIAVPPAETVVKEETDGGEQQ